MANTNNQAFIAVIKAMQNDAMFLMEQIDLAAGDLSEGRRNGAISALMPIDEKLERLAALATAVRAMHPTLPLE